MKKDENLAKISLRVGLAIAFAYAGIGSLLQPEVWIGYLPPVISGLDIAPTLLMLFSVTEIILVAWLLSGWKTKYAAMFAAAMLVGVVGANITDFTIVFRDLALIFAAVALALLS